MYARVDFSAVIKHSFNIQDKRKVLSILQMPKGLTTKGNTFGMHEGPRQTISTLLQTLNRILNVIFSVKS